MSVTENLSDRVFQKILEMFEHLVEFLSIKVYEFEMAEGRFEDKPLLK